MWALLALLLVGYGSSFPWNTVNEYIGGEEMVDLNSGGALTGTFEASSLVFVKGDNSTSTRMITWWACWTSGGLGGYDLSTITLLASNKTWYGGLSLSQYQGTWTEEPTGETIHLVGKSNTTIVSVSFAPRTIKMDITIVSPTPRFGKATQRRVTSPVFDAVKELSVCKQEVRRRWV
jgi:hypothetical protein